MKKYHVSRRLSGMAEIKDQTFEAVIEFTSQQDAQA
jgi:hypothetical protein